MIALTAPEHEDMSGEGILPEHGFGLCRERRKALPHAGDARGQPDLRVDRNRDQTVRPRISRANASGS